MSPEEKEKSVEARLKQMNEEFPEDLWEVVVSDKKNIHSAQFLLQWPFDRSVIKKVERKETKESDWIENYPTQSAPHSL